MTQLPGVTNNIIQGGINIVSQQASNPLVFGPSSWGTIGQKYTFTQVSQIEPAIGHGSVRDQVDECLKQPNVSQVDVMITSASLPGHVTAVVSTSAPVVTVTGTPTPGQIQYVSAVVDSSSSTGMKIRFSTDGGVSYSNPVSVQAGGASYAMSGSGLTLNFASGTYPVGHTSTFTAYGAVPSVADFNEQANLLVADRTFIPPLAVTVAYDCTSAASGSLMAAAVDSFITDCRGIDINTSAPGLTTGGEDGEADATVAAFTAVASSGNGLMAVAERARTVLKAPLAQRINPRVPLAYPAFARACSINASTNPARVADGPLATISDATWDERIDGSTYTQARIAAPTSFARQNGTYLQQGFNHGAETDSYYYIMWARVKDLVLDAEAPVMQKLINSSVRVNKKNGTILEIDARRIESRLNAALKATVGDPVNAEGTQGLVSAFQVSVDRTTNVLSTSTLKISTLVIPLANVSNIVNNVVLTDSIEIPVQATAV